MTGKETGKHGAAGSWRRVPLHPLDVLLLAAPVAAAAEVRHWGPLVVFFASGLAIVPLARLIGVATEALAARVGPAAGGLLNATFGNATELIIAFIALQAGLYEVVKASLAGSILGNVLVVLGLSFLIGGLGRRFQHFDRVAASTAGAQLAVAAAALVIPAVLTETTPILSGAVEQVSVVAAIVLLVSYGAGLFFSLVTHADLGGPTAGAEEREPHWGMPVAIAVLAASTVVVAIMSEFLVGAIQGVTAELGWTQTFVGVIIIALIGNAAEHASAVTVARHDQMDLSVSIALGSATQIALFVAPVLVLIGLAVGRPMDLLFETFEVAAIAISVGLVNLVVHDGVSNWLEGVQLLALYAMLAAAFFLHP